MTKKPFSPAILLAALVLLVSAVASAQVTTDPASPTAGQTVRVGYPAGGRPLSGASQMTLHWGINGWTSIRDTPMTRTAAGGFYADIVPAATATTLDFVFLSPPQADNNNGQDWHVPLQRAQDQWYFRGTPNNWGTTAMTPAGNNVHETTVTFNGEQIPARFKIDHHGNWAESYPASDYPVTDFRTYVIRFNSATKAITVTEVPGPDRSAPVVTASPAPGSYATTQSVTLTAADDQDPSPTIYFTTDGSTPTTASAVYTGQAITAGDVVPTGADLRLRTVAVDASGNSATGSFTWFIGPLADGGSDFREETIYFVLTTRFFDGDPSNNSRSPDDNSAGNPLDDPSWRGDFKGLVEKLDYIKALGFTAVWITPVIQNRSGYDYHGYHGYDFNRVDPRLESPGYDFQRLIDECHARGMKIVLDVVLNHSCNWGARGLKESSNANWLSRVENDLFPSPFYHDDWLKNYEDYTCQIGTFTGDCVDLHTEHPVVQDYLITAYNRFIAMGVDAFRIDTTKHVSRVMMNRRFIPAFKAQGGSDFFLFGEVATLVHEVWNRGVAPLSTPFYTWQERQTWSSDDEEAALQGYNFELAQGTAGQPLSSNHYLQGNSYHEPDTSRASGMSVIDFPMHWNFSNAAGAWNIRGGDSAYHNATWNVTYVDSHDYGPNMFTRYSGTEAELAENWSLMFSFRGIPCVYYGSEIQFKKGVRSDVGPSAPLSTTGRAYFGDHLAGTVSAADFGVTGNAGGNAAATLNHPLARHLQRLNRLRRAVPALQKGQYSTDGVSGSVAFKRRYTGNGIDSFVLVTVSSGATFTGIPNGRYVDAVTGDVRTVTGGSLTATCAGQGNMRVYVLDLPGNPAPGKIGTDGAYLNPAGTVVESGVRGWELY